MNTKDMVLNTLQQLSATASPIYCFQIQALQRETLSIVYHPSPADSVLLGKTKSYSWQYSEQNSTSQPQGGPTPALGFKETPLKLFDIHSKHPHNQIFIVPGEPS